MPSAAERVRDHLRQAAQGGRGFLVGAAIGTGMAAQAATRGGADFLLALNAGRMRSMGEPSIASLLALRNTNHFVPAFARAEIRPRTHLPVFVGFAGSDPRLDVDAYLDGLAAAGFEGITNFPTAVLLDGEYRTFLEESGWGFGRELSILTLAAQRGFATLAYVHTRDEAQQAATAGAAIVNVDLGWNTGGTLGVDTRLKLDEAADMAERLARAVRRIAPDTLCMVEGGPIVRPDEADAVCRAAGIDGYIGGSTIDRVPLEAAMELVTSAFKTVGALRRKISALEQRLGPEPWPLPLTGDAPAILQARAAYDRAVAAELPVAIAGPSGTGRRDLARSLHAAGRRRSKRLAWVTCGPDLALELFGAEPGGAPDVTRRRLGWLELARGSTLVLDGAIDPAVLRLLGAALESGGFRRLGGAEAMPFDVRLIGIAEAPNPPELLAGEVRVILPALADHLDDLPGLARRMMAEIAPGGAELDPATYRVLMAHRWPDSLRELRMVLQQASLLAGRGPILPAHLAPLNGPARHLREDFGTERDWIMDALRRNRFRRGEAARFLGISRKTLYNKMVAFGMLDTRAALPNFTHQVPSR